MARRARSEILYDGCYAHVFSRSIEKRTIFKDDEDFKYFLNLLMQEKLKNKFHIFHYCLMHTHFHLAVGINTLSAFSRGLQQVKWKYTRKFNERNMRWGPLWRERFKSMLIEDERYLLACGHYIEENPVKAGMVGERKNWEYSSAQYFKGVSKNKLIDSYESLGLPEDFEPDDEDEFMNGDLIGSGWFKYKRTNGIA